MAEYGIEYLRAKLNRKRLRVKCRYDYYEMKSVANDFQISTPPHLRWLSNPLGWCAKAVDSLADRLSFRGFRDDNFNLEEIFKMNNPDILFDSAMLSALISSCSFVYIYKGGDGYPRLQVVDGGNATGIMDPFTGMLKEGYAVLERDEYDQPVIEAYFVPGRTDFRVRGAEPYSITNNVPYPLLVPVVYRPDDKRPFGHSRISRACMGIQDSAARTIKRSEIAAEFYSFPQKYVNGLSEDAEIMDKWKAAMSAMLAFTKDEDGDKPVVGQFQTVSQTAHLDQLRMFAALFAGETGLTLDDLGFASGNPSSADAIRSAHENLRLAARKAQRCFGSNFVNVGMVAACLRDEFPYERKSFYRTGALWNPVFEPDGSALSGIGDALIKIDQVLPGVMTADILRDLTGLDVEAVDDIGIGTPVEIE